MRLREDADFEQKHPRDDAGRFARVFRGTDQPEIEGVESGRFPGLRFFSESRDVAALYAGTGRRATITEKDIPRGAKVLDLRDQASVEGSAAIRDLIATALGKRLAFDYELAPALRAAGYDFVAFREHLLGRHGPTAHWIEVSRPVREARISEPAPFLFRPREAAPSPVERFARSVHALRARIDALPEQTVAGIRALLTAMRRDVLSELDRVDPTTYEARRLGDLERRLQSVLDRFAEQYARVVAPGMLDAGTAGHDLGSQPLIEAGLLPFRAEISRRLVEVASQYHAGLIRKRSRRLVDEISETLRVGAVSGEPVYDVARRIAGSLHPDTVLGGFGQDAERIARTEMGRVQAIASQAAMTAAAEHIPDLRKQWEHSGNRGPYLRTGHVEAAGQIRQVHEPFRVRPETAGKGRTRYEALMFPRDPAARPENTVNCGCVSVPYREQWAGMLDRAEAENRAFLRRRAAATRAA